MTRMNAGESGAEIVGREPRLVVGIGASAGGLEASKSLLAAMPADSGMAFVVVMHLDPSHESHMAEILKSTTAMPVAQISGHERLQPNCVYVIAPSSSLELHHGILTSNPADDAGRRKPIDAFFSSLAEDQGERAVAIVLSGAGNNGSSGIRDVKTAGGLCIVQEPHTAQYDSMPRHAIETGVIDYILPPESMPGVLLGYADHPYVRRAAQATERSSESLPQMFAEILALLSRKHGLDFRLYKNATLLRRAERRMSLKQTPGWEEYLACLRQDPNELSALYRDLLIGVTRFFRDPEVWGYLAHDLAGPLLAESSEDRPLRIWVPGCATGEEPYSLAIEFLEQLTRLGRGSKMQIYATDVNEDALAVARKGVYPSTITNDVSPERLQRFFVRHGDQFQVRKEVRDSVTFAVQNVLTDPMFSRLDVVSCRNLLIYLEPAAQERLLELFHFGLRAGGMLILGSSETISKNTDLFQTLSKKHRIYRASAVTRANRSQGAPWGTQRAQVRELALPPEAPPRGPKAARVIEQLVLSRHTSACVVINQDFEILYFFGPTQDYLVQPAGEVRMDLLSWVRPGLYPRLRSVLRGVVDSREPVSIEDLRVEREGQPHRVWCAIEPITQLAGVEGLFLVRFRDVPAAATAEPAPGGELEGPLVRQLEDELKDARHELQNAIEQLDSTNEEYRASHEELVSLNEELQSTNEELETSKEELQSLNEEMVTINRQLEEKNIDLRSTNADLNNFFVSTEIPTIFLDRASCIRRFTPAATAVMRLVPSDVGRSLAHIKCRFADDRLLDDVARVLEKLSPITAEVITEEDRWYVRKVLPYRTEDDRIDGVCVTFTDATDQKRASAETERARHYAEAIVATVPTPLIVLSEELDVLSANDCFYDTFRVSRVDTEGKKLYELGNRQWDIPGLRNLLEKVLPGAGEIQGYEVTHTFDTIGARVMAVHARRMTEAAPTPSILIAIEDITERKQRAQMLAEEDHRKDEFLAMLGHELRNPLSALAHGLELLGGDMSLARPEVQKLREMMVRQTSRIGAMLDQLLDIARVSSGKVELAKEPVDLAGVIRSAMETVRLLIGAQKQSLTLEFAREETAFVLGDRVRLSQVVENLLTNAAKYTPDGGRISVSLELDEDAVRIIVQDSGIGMSADLVPHIFEVFTQAPRMPDRSKGGLGLGLPLVRRLVEMHGGQVAGSSPGLGNGSQFTVTLPRLRQSPPVSPAEPTTSPAQGPRRRILVVDDETDAADALAKLLERAGHVTAVSHDGATALLAARSFEPDVVLLDIGLPEMDGYEVARRLRADLGDAPVLLVALTGYRKDANRLAKAGFDEHLLKPPGLEQLRTLLAVRSPARAQD